MRWHHPERGLVPPGEFIPVAEESGAIVADRRVRAARSPAPRRRAGTPRAGASAQRLGQPVAAPARPRRAWSRWSRTCSPETGLDPATLTLEITEGVLVTESEATAQTLLDLKALGLRLVLDDFGTGYSSLAYLRRFPIDGLKIDRRFIAAMDTSTPGQDDRRGDRQDGRRPADRRRRRGRRDARAGREPAGASAASTPRASITRGRCRPTTWPGCSTARCPPRRDAHERAGCGRAAAGRLKRARVRHGGGDPALARGRRQHAVERQRRLDHLLRERAIPQQLRPLVHAAANGEEDRRLRDPDRARDRHQRRGQAGPHEAGLVQVDQVREGDREREQRRRQRDRPTAVAPPDQPPQVVAQRRRGRGGRGRPPAPCRPPAAAARSRSGAARRRGRAAPSGASPGARRVCTPAHQASSWARTTATPLALRRDCRSSSSFLRRSMRSGRKTCCHVSLGSSPSRR